MATDEVSIAVKTPSPAAATASSNVNQSELIIIHVCDEARQINRDFACDRSVLLEEMKYFQSYLGGDSGSFDDIDISVHCDVHIFEWLVQWIHSPLRPPPLDSSSVVSILISSEFLEMERLVEHCLRFMAKHIDEILHMPIDLAYGVSASSSFPGREPPTRRKESTDVGACRRSWCCGSRSCARRRSWRR